MPDKLKIKVMARRSMPEVNAGSMADIAFLLLIFFLVTTTMNVDTGILRKLPPLPHGKQEHTKVNERNVFVVLINKDNMLAIKGNPATLSELRQRIKEFITNPTNDPHLSEQINIQQKLQDELSKKKPDQQKINIYKKIIAEIGPNVAISRGVISLQNDRGTKYGKYIQVQNEIVGAINDLRNELARQTWGKDFSDLKPYQQKMVRTIYPFAISEAEPRSLAKK